MRQPLQCDRPRSPDGLSPAPGRRALRCDSARVRPLDDRPGCFHASRFRSVRALASPLPIRDMAMNDAPQGETPQVPEYMRRIRSFVLREGRMTPAQQRAFDEHWSRYGVDYHAAVHDFDARFGRVAPRVLEIGFGNGEALAWASENDPARDFIGVEVHGPGVGRLMNVLAARDATNVRLYKHDAVEVLTGAFLSC
ncbi:MAG: hypothetical protein WDW38_010144 [Sanguina aurantia]